MLLAAAAGLAYGLPDFASAQDHLPLENALPVHLGDSESRVRSVFKVFLPSYPTPFAAGRSTLKAGDGIFIDFVAGKVVEVDVTSKSSGLRIGHTMLGSDLASASKDLGVTTVPPARQIVYTARDGEILELRFGGDEPRVQVFALVGDRTHAPTTKAVGRVILRNSGAPASPPR